MPPSPKTPPGPSMPPSPKVPSPRREMARLAIAKAGSAIKEFATRAITPPMSKFLRPPAEDISYTRVMFPVYIPAETNELHSKMATALMDYQTRQRAAQGLAVAYIMLFRNEYKDMAGDIEKWVDIYMPLDIKHEFLECASNLDLWLFKEAVSTSRRVILTPKVYEAFVPFFSTDPVSRRMKCRPIARTLLDVAVKAVSRAGPGLTLLEAVREIVWPRAGLFESPVDLETVPSEVAQAIGGIDIRINSM